MEWLTSHLTRLPPQFAATTRDLLVSAMAGEGGTLSEAQAGRLTDLYDEKEAVAMRREAISRATKEGQVDAARRLMTDLDESDRAAVVAAAFARVREKVDSHLGEALFLADHRSFLDRQQLFQFAQLLAEAIHAKRRLVPTVAPLLASIELPDPDQRTQIVEALLATEADMADSENRMTVLEAAADLAGEAAGPARC